MNFPRCPECGGKVELIAKPDRQRQLEKNLFVNIPDDFKIPTCVDCLEESMIPEVSEKLDKLLRNKLNHD